MNRTLLAGAIFGASSVLLGAYGAHGLSALLLRIQGWKLLTKCSGLSDASFRTLSYFGSVFTVLVRVPNLLTIILCASILFLYHLWMGYGRTNLVD